MAPADPLLLVWSAVNRINSNGDVLAPEEKVGLFTAIKAVTIEAARSIRMEKEIGTISTGKKADFVVFDTDNFNNILYHQGSLKPSMVFINGEKYEFDVDR